MSRTGNFLTGAVTAGAVLAAGYLAYEAGMLPKIPGLPEVHAPDLGKKPTTVELGGMAVKDQKLTGTTQVVTFGTAEIDVTGQPSNATYYDNFLTANIFHRIFSTGDAVETWNLGDKVARVTGLPCITTSPDYNKPIAESDTTKTSSNQSTAPIGYTINFDTSGKPTNIKITSGAIDICAPRLENPEELVSRPQTVLDSGFLSTPFGQAEDATFRKLMRNLTVSYAMSQACPDKLVSPDSVDRTIAKLVVGQLVLDPRLKPIASEITALYNDSQYGPDGASSKNSNTVVVTRPDDTSRQGDYNDRFNKQLAAAAAMTQTYPEFDPSGQNKTYDFRVDTSSGKFIKTTCSANNIKIAAAQ